MARRRFSWTAKQRDRLDKVREVLDEFSTYKPLTLRQIYYQLVSKQYLENRTSQYKMLSNLLKWARIDGYIAWADVEDRARSFQNLRGFPDKSAFLKAALPSLVKAYDRDVWASQPRYVEVWIEKDALKTIFTRICSQFGVSVVVCRGFSSVSFLHEFAERVKHFREPVMLYFGDFDPSGLEMLEAMRTTVHGELQLPRVSFRRIALLQADIHKHDLPHDPSALKWADSRARKHVAKYGELAVELDALRPNVLEDLIQKAIVDQIEDRDEFARQQLIAVQELEELQALCGRILDEVEDGTSAAYW